MKTIFARCYWENTERDDHDVEGVLIDVPNNAGADEIEDKMYKHLQNIFGDNIIMNILYIKVL